MDRDALRVTRIALRGNDMTNVVTVQTHGLAQRVMDGQRELARLDTSSGLRDAAIRIIDAVKQSGCSVLIPASAAARGPIAGAILLAGDELSLSPLHDFESARARNVLIVEAAAVSGMKLTAAVTSAREQGASRVGALVLIDLREPDDRSEPAVEWAISGPDLGIAS